MEVSQLFTRGFEVLKKNYVIAVPLIAVGILVSILGIILFGGAMAGIGMMGMGGFTPGMASMGAFFGAALLIGVIGGLLNMIALGMTFVLADQALKDKADLNIALNRTMGNIINLVVASILVGVIVFIGMMLVVLPGVIAAYLLMFALVLVMLENKAPIASLQESFELVKANLNNTIVFAVIAIVIIILGGAVGGVFRFIPFLGDLIGSVISALLTAYVSIVLVLLYKDLKNA